MGELNPILAALGITQKELIRAIIADSFIIDYGIVVAVDGNKVDVQHAVMPLVAGQQLGTTLTKGVEVIWPSSAQLSFKMDLVAGDTVLLVGFKDYVGDAGVTSAGTTDVKLHYSQETMKAIPMGVFNSSASVPIQVSGGVMTIGDSASAQPVARQNDGVLIDSTTDQVGMSILTSMLGIPSLVGKVNAGSSKVKAQ